MARDRAVLSIGALSARTGCNVETIRYYERIGVLPRTARTAVGHRVYAPEQAKRLTFVRRSRELGFSLDQVRSLLALADGQTYDCDKVKRLALDHADEIRGKIADLRTIEQVLARLAARCRGGTVPECPVIEALFAGSARSGGKGKHESRSAS